jgi:hypothetical protein
MGGRLTTPPSSTSASSTTAHRTASTTGSSNNLSHPRTQSTSSSNHRPRSSSGHHHHHPAHTNRHRTTSTNIDSMSSSAAAAFNFNFLRYVGLEQESDDPSTDDESPQARRRLQRLFIALRDVACPVCHKTIPSDSFDKHILQCLSKPRIDYNGLLFILSVSCTDRSSRLFVF